MPPPKSSAVFRDTVLFEIVGEDFSQWIPPPQPCGLVAELSMMVLPVMVGEE
jgi:hypothetical protein